MNENRYKRPESRKSETSTLGEVLQEMLASYRIKDRFDNTKIIADWPELMGAPIANRTKEIYIKDKVMHVKLSSAPLRQELSMTRPHILKIIAEKYGDNLVTEIRFY